MSNKKIKSKLELKQIVSTLKERGKKVVFTNGCFGVIHPGHVDLLEKAKSFGDILIVAVNTDGSVKKLKGPRRPIYKLSGRMKVLSALEAVDYVTSFPEDTPIDILKELRPDILVKGGDWKPDEVVGKNFIESYGGKVKIVPHLKNYSTTSLIEKLSKGPIK